MSKRDITASAFRRIAAMTDREYWQGIMYLGIPQEIAAASRKRALRCYRSKP